MKTIRRSVFETNSSTTHCVTFSKSYKTVKDIPLRDASQFPKLNRKKEIEIELDIYWDISVKESDIDLNSPVTILKYLAAHVVFSSQEIMYGRKNPEYNNHFEENYDLFLKDVQEAYKLVGLKPPKDIKIYFLDINDEKIYITKDNIFKWIVSKDNSWYSSIREWKKMVSDKIKKNPDAANWPYAKKHFGMCGNDLCGSSYASSTEYFYNVLDVYDYDNESENQEQITTVDVISRQIGLDFYHS